MSSRLFLSFSHRQASPSAWLSVFLLSFNFACFVCHRVCITFELFTCFSDDDNRRASCNCCNLMFPVCHHRQTMRRGRMLIYTQWQMKQSISMHATRTRILLRHFHFSAHNFSTCTSAFTLFIPQPLTASVLHLLNDNNLIDLIFKSQIIDSKIAFDSVQRNSRDESSVKQ